MSLDTQISKIEEFIRQGHRDQAIELIKSIKITTVPRLHINNLANLARRTGQLELAWKIISPIIRPKVALDKPATPEEIATYAIILLGLGARPEAFDLLESATDKNAPEVQLAWAFVHMNCWDYASAVSRLKNYLKAKNISPYQQMIAQVNLAASLVASGKTKEAEPLLAEILKKTQHEGWNLLYRNALEISAQLAVQNSNWSQGESFLKAAVHDDSKNFYLDQFFIEKWRAIIKLLKEKGSPDSLEALARVRKKASENKHWETIRDCDFYKAQVTEDQNLAASLYYGTPYFSYRERLLKGGASWIKIPQHYTWSLTGDGAGRIFHLSQGEEVSGPARMKSGTALHKLFVALASDFYRPFSIGFLHSLVYPKEFFNPDSSPRRVAFLIQRLRAWFKEEGLPFVILAEDDGFKLTAEASVQILLEKSTPTLRSTQNEGPSQYLVLIKKLKAEKKSQALKAAEIAEISKLSIRSVRYFIKWAKENKKMQQIGTGRDSKYKIK